MENHTFKFKTLVDMTVGEHASFYEELKNLKSDTSSLQKKIAQDLGLNYQHFQNHPDFTENIKEHIQNYLIENKQASMNVEVLKQISKQVEIDYYLKNITEDEAKLYRTISDAVRYYGICNTTTNITSFDNRDFWKNLIHKLYVLNFANPMYINFQENAYTKDHPDFNKLIRLTDSVKNIKNLGESIDIIDGSIVFEDGQEDRIIKKIEKKISHLNLFAFLHWVFDTYQLNKINNNIEHAYPYKYIINFLIKNIAHSKHKHSDEKKFKKILTLINSFVSLYQIKVNKFKTINITQQNIIENLKKQVLYSSCYPIYPLKNQTLISFTDNLIKSSIDEQKFIKRFGFTVKDLIGFFNLLDKQNDHIIYFDKFNTTVTEKKILDFFAVDASVINQNVCNLSKLSKSKNLFMLNPIVKYKNKFYVIGFKYFKMNFYNAMVEKIRTQLDKNINQKIGINIDSFVEKIFKKVLNDDKNVFSGTYSLSKTEKLENDLLIKSGSDIILIENKNKYLTGLSFSGSESHILKDIIFSFITSQKQLFTHERNIRKYVSIKFEDQRSFKYNNENIIKVSVSTNNWFSIMNNIPYQLIYSLLQLRFDVDKDGSIKYFSEANTYLDNLEHVVKDIYANFSKQEIKTMFNQSLFLPLELIVDKYKDDNFIENFKQLVHVKMNTPNIMDTYDYIQYWQTVRYARASLTHPTKNP